MEAVQFTRQVTRPSSTVLRGAAVWASDSQVATEAGTPWSRYAGGEQDRSPPGTIQPGSFRQEVLTGADAGKVSA